MTSAASLPISMRGLSKSYGDTFALDHVDLDVHSGEFLTLLGPSGSGKTTLLMTLAGFTRPDHGGLKFGNTDILRTPPHERDLGMVFQSYALFPHMNVGANVAFPLRLRKVPKADIEKRVAQALTTVQLAGFAERRVSQLSGGQQQRVALARAIVFEPRILLMDEPLSALDKKLREQMQIELRHLHDKLGMTTVYVTHDQREALTMSDRIAVINQGKLMQLGTPQEIYDQPANKFVADFVGESSFLRVRVANGNASYAGEVLKLRSAPADAQHNLLMLRPERLHILADETGDVANQAINKFRGTVKDLVYQGDSYLMYVTLADGAEVSVRGVIQSGTVAALPASGGSITLALHQDDAVLMSAAD